MSAWRTLARSADLARHRPCGRLAGRALRPAETVEWSRVRYTGYSFLAVEVQSATSGHTTTLSVTALAETGERVDHFTIARKAK
jgi:hypothetical protein